MLHIYCTYSKVLLESPHTFMQRWSLSLCICANGNVTGKVWVVTGDCSSRMFANELLYRTLVALQSQKGRLVFLVATDFHPSSFQNNNTGKLDVILFRFYPFSSLEAWYIPPPPCPPSPSSCLLHLLPAFMVMRVVTSLLNTQARAGPLVKLQPQVPLPPTITSPLSGPTKVRCAGGKPFH